MSRAQFITIDVIFSFTVFLLVIQTFIAVSGRIHPAFSEAQRNIQMERAATWASEYLMNRGLCSRKNILSQDVIDSFEVLPYDDQKQAMGLPNFEFQIRIQNTTIGADPSIAETSIVSQRVGYFEGNKTIVTLVVWK